MTKQEPIAAAHPNVYAALAAAQAEMEAPTKSAQNPHFKSRYADLSEVVRVALPALSKHGLAWFSRYDATGDGCMVSVIAHGASDTSVECPVPLLLNKRDMQGLGSAMTYARRYGLLSLTGLAPEDDDGNAAVKNGPVVEPARKPAVAAAIDEEVANVEKKAKAVTFAKDFAAKVGKAEGPLDGMQLVFDNAAALARLEAYPDALAAVEAALAAHNVTMAIHEGRAVPTEGDLPGVKEGARFMAAG